MISRFLRMFLACAALAAGPQAALAQFTNAPASGGSASSGAQTQPEDAISSFDEIDVQVRRVLVDPTQENTFRVILSVTDTGDQPRKVAFLQPPTVLIDDLGNAYQAVAASGIQICSNREIWDMDMGNCIYYQPDDTTRLTNGVPTTVVLTFAPGTAGFSKELAALAETASIQSRIGYYALDGKTPNYADIIINNIPIPQGGS